MKRPTLKQFFHGLSTQFGRPGLALCRPPFFLLSPSERYHLEKSTLRTCILSKQATTWSTIGDHLFCGFQFFPGQFVPFLLFKLKFILCLHAFFAGTGEESGHFFFWCKQAREGSDTLIHTQFVVELWKMRAGWDGNSRRHKRSGCVLLPPFFFFFGRHLSHITFLICQEGRSVPACLLEILGVACWGGGGGAGEEVKCRREGEL